MSGSRRYVRPILLIILLLFAISGTIILARSKAATPFVIQELENASLINSAQIVNDSTASGGAAVRFGGPTPTAVMKYVSAVSSNGRYLVDQQGTPLLIKGDSPWSMAIDISNADAEWYFTQRQNQGFNSVLFSAFGGEGTGVGDSKPSKLTTASHRLSAAI